MNATEKQIKEWKEQYGELFRISVDGKSGYFHKPSRTALGYAQVAGRDNPIKANEVLMKECWVAGDEELKTDDSLFLSVSNKLGDLLEIKEAELEKL